ncbi:hypothetical protein J6590_101990, partial [Homalodisca vitripennis]
MSADGLYARHAELQSVSELFLNFWFRVYQEYGGLIVKYGFGGNIHDLLFSGNRDNGRYSVLKDSSTTPIRETLDINKCQSPKRERSEYLGVVKKFKFTTRCAVSNATPDVSPYSVGGLEEVSATARRLILDDVEWQRALEEASSFQIPHQLIQPKIAERCFKNPLGALAKSVVGRAMSSCCGRDRNLLNASDICRAGDASQVLDVTR